MDVLPTSPDPRPAGQESDESGGSGDSKIRPRRWPGVGRRARRRGARGGAGAGAPRPRAPGSAGRNGRSSPGPGRTSCPPRWGSRPRGVGADLVLAAGPGKQRTRAKGGPVAVKAPLDHGSGSGRACRRGGRPDRDADSAVPSARGASTVKRVRGWPSTPPGTPCGRRRREGAHQRPGGGGAAAADHQPGGLAVQPVGGVRAEPGRVALEQRTRVLWWYRAVGWMGRPAGLSSTRRSSSW